MIIMVHFPVNKNPNPISVYTGLHGPRPNFHVVSSPTENLAWECDYKLHANNDEPFSMLKGRPNKQHSNMYEQVGMA